MPAEQELSLPGKGGSRIQPGEFFIDGNGGSRVGLNLVSLVIEQSQLEPRSVCAPMQLVPHALESLRRLRVTVSARQLHPRPGQRDVLTWTFAIEIGDGNVVQPFGQPLLGGLLVPANRFGFVARDASSLRI